MLEQRLQIPHLLHTVYCYTTILFSTSNIHIHIQEKSLLISASCLDDQVHTGAVPQQRHASSYTISVYVPKGMFQTIKEAFQLQILSVIEASCGLEYHSII